MKESETKVQNKIAIIALNIAIYFGIIGFFETIKILDGSITLKIYVYFLGGFPLFFYVLYLVFLPLRYKSNKPNEFEINSLRFKLSLKKVNYLFDLGATSFPTMLFLMPIYILSKTLLQKLGVDVLNYSLLYILGMSIIALPMHLLLYKIFQLFLLEKSKKKPHLPRKK